MYGMATKTISITEEAYERLATQMRGTESFSDVILRMTGKVRLSDFAGVLSTSSARRVEERIHALRKQSRVRARRVREALQL
jgi:predicted CopG family antitoxin